MFPRSADSEVGDTAGLETCVTPGVAGSTNGPGGTPRQRAESSRITQNPICATGAGWPPAVPEGQNASPGGLRPSSPSGESSEEPGFLRCRGRFLAGMKFSSQGMLTAERAPAENTTFSLTGTFPPAMTRRFLWQAQLEHRLLLLVEKRLSHCSIHEVSVEV